MCSQIECTTNHSATFNPVQHVCNPVHSQTLHVASLKQDRITAISNNTNLRVVTNVTQNIGQIAQHIPCHTCRYTHTHLHHNSHLTAVHYVSVHYTTHCYSRFIVPVAFTRSTLQSLTDYAETSHNSQDHTKVMSYTQGSACPLNDKVIQIHLAISCSTRQGACKLTLTMQDLSPTHFL